METTLNSKDLTVYVNRQLSHFYPDNDSDCSHRLDTVMKQVLNRLEKCFSKIKIHYYKNETGDPFFNHLNGDHYSMFLYLLSNQLYEYLGDEKLASKCFLLNKMMFGLDAFYKIKLPDHFLFVHPVGTVLGNALYGDYLVVYQNVTVGSKTDGIYPKCKGRNILYSGSTIIGNSELGLNSTMGANAFILDYKVPDHQIVIGTHPANKFLFDNHELISSCFDI